MAPVHVGQLQSRTTTLLLAQTQNSLRSTSIQQHRKSIIPLTTAQTEIPGSRSNVATTRRTTKALRTAPGATATPGSKYLRPSSDETQTRTHTIVFNPPPSLPTPYQTPSLFLPASDPRKTLLSQSHHFNNPYLSGARQLPPPVRELAPETKRYHLSEKDITRIRTLRAADPWKWTVTKLAERFDCSKIFINIVAPASKERKEWGLALHQRFRDRWGQTRRDAVAARHKRRVLWEKDL